MDYGCWKKFEEGGLGEGREKALNDDKGKLPEREGRKAVGLRLVRARDMAARLPGVMQHLPECCRPPARTLGGVA